MDNYIGKVKCIARDDFGETEIGVMYDLYGSENTSCSYYIITPEWPTGRFLLKNENAFRSHEDGPNLYELVDEKNTQQTDSNPNESGVKYDSGKPRVSLIPRAAILGMARALSYGEKKYGTHNFRNGLSYSRLADACMRHLLAFMEGENIDSESGLSHMDHAIATLAMLKFMEEHRADMDDRWLDPQFQTTEDPLTEEDKLEVAEEIQRRGR